MTLRQNTLFTRFLRMGINGALPTNTCGLLAAIARAFATVLILGLLTAAPVLFYLWGMYEVIDTLVAGKSLSKGCSVESFFFMGLTICYIGTYLIRWFRDSMWSVKRYKNLVELIRSIKDRTCAKVEWVD